MKPFLTAEWNWLTNITYAVDPAVLLPYLPKGLELDTIEGKAYVSIVPFNFNNTRVRNIRVPFHTDFPELNLRFYVKHRQRRGVVFIREYVPRLMVAFVANALYSEQYRVASMKNTVNESSSEVHARYELLKDRKKFSIDVIALNKPYTPAADSIEHYFKEHDLGFSSAPGSTRAYLVEHPVWEALPVKEVKLNIDCGSLFGDTWSFLDDEKPFLTMFLKGSSIKVFPDMKLESIS